MTEINERAEACAVIARNALIRPDCTQIWKEYEEPLDKSQKLILRTTARSGWTPDYLGRGDLHTNRYLYLYQDQSIVFSLDIDSIPSSELQGSTERSQELVKASCFTENENVYELVRLTRKVTSGGIDDSDVDEMNRLYMLISELGKTTTFSFRTFEIDDRQVVVHQHEDETGLYLPSHYGPPLSVMLRNDPDKNNQQLVLDQLPGGKFETYTGLVDDTEEIASYLSEEDVIRDEDGNISWIRNFLDKKQAVIEAERAIGIRKLSDPYLKLIETAMADVATVIANE